jgi:hypothetical protein
VRLPLCLLGFKRSNKEDSERKQTSERISVNEASGISMGNACFCSQ